MDLAVETSGQNIELAFDLGYPKASATTIS